MELPDPRKINESIYNLYAKLRRDYSQTEPRYTGPSRRDQALENYSRQRVVGADELLADSYFLTRRVPWVFMGRKENEDQSMDAMAYGLTRGDRFVGMRSDSMWIMDDIHQEEVAMKEIKITPVLNGFIVKVGCSKIVFTDLKEMANELKRYYGAKEPWKVEEEWANDSINSGKMVGATPQAFASLRDAVANSPSRGVACERD